MKSSMCVLEEMHEREREREREREKEREREREREREIFLGCFVKVEVDDKEEIEGRT